MTSKQHTNYNTNYNADNDTICDNYYNHYNYAISGTYYDRNYDTFDTEFWFIVNLILTVSFV